MRFQPGVGYPYPERRRPRGPGYKPYRMSYEARQQRRRNLGNARKAGKLRVWRSSSESQIIKLWIWQAFISEPRPSQRTVARQLGVWPSYVCKVQKQAVSVGWAKLARFGRPVTLDDLAEERRGTANIRKRAPYLFVPESRRSHATSSAPMPAPAATTQKSAPAVHQQTDYGYQCCERCGKRRVPLGYQIYVRLSERCVCGSLICDCPPCRSERVITEAKASRSK